MTDDIRWTWICDPCRAGSHPHDRRTDDGSDGGCPRAWWVDGGMRATCNCAVRLPPRRPAMR